MADPSIFDLFHDDRHDSSSKLFAKAENHSRFIRKRMELYRRTESVTNIPWNYLAAIDQYETKCSSVK